MLRFSANISTLFTEWPLLDRPAAAADAGFAAVEMQFPYEVEADALAAACAKAGVPMVLINLPAGDRTRGELGLACLPDRAAEFAAGVEQAITYAKALGVDRVNCLAGRLPAGLPDDAVLIANIRHAAERLAAEDILLLVEPLNRRDHPDFALAGLAEADALITAVDHPNLALQFDAHHLHAAGDDWQAAFVARAGTIGHLQFSDFPGRHEPGTGELAIDRLFELVAASPYRGWTGAEYRPSGATLDSLGWFTGRL